MEFDFAVGFVAEGGDVVAFVADDVAGLGGVEEHAEFDIIRPKTPINFLHIILHSQSQSHSTTSHIWRCSALYVNISLRTIRIRNRNFRIKSVPHLIKHRALFPKDVTGKGGGDDDAADYFGHFLDKLGFGVWCW